jgi:hypothetical protein
MRLPIQAAPIDRKASGTMSLNDGVTPSVSCQVCEETCNGDSNCILGCQYGGCTV